MDARTITQKDLSDFRASLEATRDGKPAAPVNVEMMLAVLDLYDDARRELMVMAALLQGLNAAFHVMQIMDERLPPSPVPKAAWTESLANPDGPLTPEQWIAKLKEGAEQAGMPEEDSP